jgi:hypothetical protein
MTSTRSNTGSPAIGSFREAQRFQLQVSLSITCAERLRDLEAMFDFNDMIEELNPHTRRAAALLRATHDVTPMDVPKST